MRSSNSRNLCARLEELLDTEWAMNTVYGIYGATQLTVFVLIHFIPHFLKVYTWPRHFLLPIFGDDVTLIISTVFVICYVPIVNWCIGAYGPWMMRRLLFVLFVGPKLKRIECERYNRSSNHVNPGTFASSWLWTRQAWRSSMRRLWKSSRGMSEPLGGFAAVHLEDQQQSLSQNSPGAGAEAPDRATRNYTGHEVANNRGARLGTWVGSNIGRAVHFSLGIGVKLGDWCTRVSTSAQAMRAHRIRQDFDEEFPGDIAI